MAISKNYVDDSEDVIWKYNFAFLQTYFYYSKPFENKMKKMKICHQKCMLSTQLQNKSFHALNFERSKLNNPRVKRAKLPFSILKYANL